MSEGYYKGAIDADGTLSLIREAIDVQSAKGVADWCMKMFKDNCTKPFADFHHRVFRWVDRIKPGMYIEALVECWGRGLAKSSIAEMVICFLAERGLRTFGLYVCETSDLAQAHLKEIAANLTHLDLDQELDDNGKRVAWNRKQLRIKNFVIVAVGLNEAVRGIKVRGKRPDFMILDDIDADTDTVETREKKKAALTQKILPAGSTDCIVMFVQNKISAESIMASMMNGTADFLTDRAISDEVPAIYDATFEPDVLPSGRGYMKITGGTPAWVGMGLDVCQQFILKFGFEAFKRECQHAVDEGHGYFFNTAMLRCIKPENLPKDDLGLFEPLAHGMSWDFAATQDGGDWTVGARGAYFAKAQQFFFTKIARGQWSTEFVRKTLYDESAELQADYPDAHLITMPKDPGQAGVFQMNQLTRLLSGMNTRFVPRNVSKALTARGLQEAVNSGNVFFVTESGDEEPWVTEAKREMRSFKDTNKSQVDDQIDAMADFVNAMLTGQPRATSRLKIKKAFTHVRSQVKAWMGGGRLPDEDDDDEGEWSERERRAIISVKRAV